MVNFTLRQLLIHVLFNACSNVEKSNLFLTQCEEFLNKTIVKKSVSYVLNPFKVK